MNAKLNDLRNLSDAIIDTKRSCVGGILKKTYVSEARQLAAEFEKEARYAVKYITNGDTTEIDAIRAEWKGKRFAK